MADLSNNSFIPKRGPVKRGRGSATRQVYVFTLISYVLMFATLLATGGVYLYGKHIDKELENKVKALNIEVEGFDEADMQKVLDFDLRLSQANNRLNNSVSIVSVFDVLETATIDTIKIISLDLQREGDDKFALSASIETDSFDSTIFQRGVYQRNEAIESVLISNVTMAADGEGKSGGEATLAKQPVTFTASIEIPISSVLYGESKVIDKPITITNPVTDQATSTEEDPATILPVGNIENI